MQDEEKHVAWSDENPDTPPSGDSPIKEDVTPADQEMIDALYRKIETNADEEN